MSAPALLSVVIPAYNEAQRIGPSLERVHAHLESRGKPYEVLVVNDGSLDATGDQVQRFVASHSRFRLLTFSPNHGKGWAVRTGILAAAGDPVLFADADLSTPIDVVDRFEAALASGHDVAIASRTHRDTVIVGWNPWYRRLSGRTFNAVIRMLTGLSVRDTQCGFKAFRRVAAQAIFRRARIDGFAFDVEALYLAKKLEYRVTELPIRWENADDSKVNVARDSWPMVREVMRIRRLDRAGAYEEPR
ncbi:MAG: glycosyltransferase family 2 protein [Planctomycetes bacterium]|nr:glycosyltransferase family 2 protein [Planctomycetota bacterium]